MGLCKGGPQGNLCKILQSYVYFADHLICQLEQELHEPIDGFRRQAQKYTRNQIPFVVLGPQAQ